MSLKRQRQLTLKRPDDMLKPPEWLRRPPETFLNVLRLLRLVLKKPDVWQRMHEDLKAIQGRKVMLVLVVKQVRRVRVGRKVSRESADLRAYRARKVIQENGDLRECRGQLAHVVRPGHREQWGRVVKPGPEAKKEIRGGLRDQRGILVREVSRGRQEQRESAVRPDLRGRKGNPGNVVRKDYRAPPEREVNRVRQVRKVNEAKLDLRDLVGSQARRAAQQMWQMRRRHRRELCS